LKLWRFAKTRRRRTLAHARCYFPSAAADGLRLLQRQTSKTGLNVQGKGETSKG